jgi:hypothetical protein
MIQCDPMSFVVPIAPTAPQNVNVMGVTSFALEVTWEPPEEDGGRPIKSYNVSVENLVFVVPVTDPRMLLIVDKLVFMEAMTYT